MRIFFILTLLLAQPQAPWFGAWRLNLEKSKLDGEVRFKRTIIRIEPWDGGLKATYDLVGVRGGVTHMEWTGKFDGKDYPVQGVDYVLTNAYTRENDRSYRIVTKIDGVAVSTAKVDVSPDGKTLTTVTTGKNAQGNSITTTSIYERER